MSIQATIAITVDWLCKHRPVAFTNRTKDQPLLADPFTIYQQVVKDNKAFFRVHARIRSLAQHENRPRRRAVSRLYRIVA